MTGTAVAERPQTRVEAFMMEVLPPHKRHDIYASLPAHISPARFERNLVNAVMREPKLLRVDPRIVYREVSKIAAVGLLLDPAFGEAYLIVDRNNDVQARFGYRGLIKLARQSGLVANVFAHEICEHDEFSVQLGTSKRIDHTPRVMGDRGPAGAYYAVVEFKEGPPDFEIMSIREVEEIRDRSDAWKAFRKGVIKSTPWATDPGEMSKKTVLRRLLKRIPMSPELSDALAHEDNWDARDSRDDAVVSSTLQSRLSGPVGQGFSRQHVEDEMGEEAAAAAEDDGEEARGQDDQRDDGGYADRQDGQPEAGHQDDAAGDPDAPAEQASEAYEAGRQACREGMGLSAMPGDYSAEDIADWKAGWKDEKSAQGGNR